MSSNNLAKNTIIYALGDIIPKVFNLVTFPILTSYLPIADYGVVNYVYSIELFLTIITFLCLKTYYLVHYYKVGDEIEQKKMLGNLTIVVATLNVIVSVVLLILGPFIFKSIGSDVNFYPYIALGVGINFLSIFSQLPSALYRVRENPLPLTLINVLQGALIMILTIIFVIREPKAETVLLVKLLVTGICSSIFIYVTLKNAIFSFNKEQLKQALKFSLPLVPGDIAYYFTSMSDRILIERFLSVVELGIYSTASTISGLLNIVSYGAYKAFEPYFFKTYGTNDFTGKFVNIRDTLLFVVLSGAIGLSIYSLEALEFFATDEYSDAHLYVPVLVLGICLSTLASLYGTILTAQSKTKMNGLVSVVSAFISVGINVALLPIIGIWSAAVASVLVFFFRYFSLKLFSHLKVPMVRPFIATLVSVLFVYLVVYRYTNVNFIIKSLSYTMIVFLLTRVLKINISLKLFGGK